MKRLTPFALAALLLAACGSGDDVSVDNAWARASAAGQTSGAIYFDLTVSEDDTLVGASVPSSVAERAEIHEVVMDDGEMDEGSMDDGDMSGEMSGEMVMDETEMSEGSESMDMAGNMRMQELADGLALTGGASVSFEPGSFHVMMPVLAEPLEIGDEFDLTLEFANADDVTVTVEVAETAP